MTVTPAGIFDYDPGLTYLSGWGTSTLALHGLPVTVDPRGQSSQSWGLFWATGWLDSGEVASLRLLPGDYLLSTGGGWAQGTVTVTRAGTVDYDPGLTYLSGRGTSTLVLHGLPVVVDPRGQSAYWAFEGATVPVSPGEVASLRLLPGVYQLWTGIVGPRQGVVTVTPGGTFDFDPGLTYLSGRGTSTLALHGLPVAIDATRLSAQAFALAGATSWLDAWVVQSLRLLPGQYRFQTPAADVDFVLTVTPAGTFDYDPALTYLSGRGTSMLIVGPSSRTALSGQVSKHGSQLSDVTALVLLAVLISAGWRARRARARDALPSAARGHRFWGSTVRA